MTQDNKLIKLVIKFIRLTIDKEIKWEICEVPKNLKNGTDDIISNFYVTKYLDKKFALFTRRYQQYSGEFDTLYWTSETKLAILDKDQIIWENQEQIPAIQDLLRYVQEQVSGLDDILDQLLAD